MRATGGESAREGGGSRDAVATRLGSLDHVCIRLLGKSVTAAWMALSTDDHTQGTGWLLGVNSSLVRPAERSGWSMLPTLGR
jgi:hypothetical protein